MTEERELRELCESIRELDEMVESWTRESREKRLTRQRHAAAGMERLFTRGAIEMKRATLSPDLRSGTFAGYGATRVSHPTSAWGLPRDWTDVIAKGAFEETLA